MEKAEVEEKSSENSQEMIKGETPPPYQPSSYQIKESLKIINEETSQLSEFILQEEKLIKELCVLLKHVLKRLNMSFNLPTNIFPYTSKTQQIILNDEGHLIFTNNKNEVKSKALEDYPPQIILNVASLIIPELSKSLTSYRKGISLRIGIFDRINQELRNVHNAIASHPKELGGDLNPLNNGVKKNKRNKESA